MSRPTIDSHIAEQTPSAPWRVPLLTAQTLGWGLGRIVLPQGDGWYHGELHWHTGVAAGVTNGQSASVY